MIYDCLCRSIDARFEGKGKKEGKETAHTAVTMIYHAGARVTFAYLHVPMCSDLQHCRVKKTYR